MTEQDERAWLDEQREQMQQHLMRAAEHFGVMPAGRPVHGLHHRSASVLVTSDAGQGWMRVGREYIRWVEDAEVGDFWTGIPDSNAIVGVTKPQVMASTEWDDADGERRVRADLMTVISSRACSPTDALRAALDLPSAWWAELRRNVDTIAATTTNRYADRPARAGKRVGKVFGQAAAEAFRPAEFETTHGDLHWSNVVGPEFGILDWELWGPGPVGVDAATLYLFSLLVPEASKRVYQVFGDVLDSAAGQAAQVSVASRILARADEGENLDLADVVRAYIAPILDSRLRR